MSNRFDGFYNWEETFTYDAPMTLVIGQRSVGKTYGLRKQCIYDWIKDGSNFVEICRTDVERKDVSDGYFDKLSNDPDFSDYVFKSDTRHGYIAKKPAEGEKPKWQHICYFVAMTLWQRDKKKTFINCKRFIFDEAIIDNMDRFHRYLPNEVVTLAEIVRTCSREGLHVDVKSKPRIYCLGNACDFINSIFVYFKINEVPKYGYSWYGNKALLIHFIEPDSEHVNYAKDHTTAGKILANDPAGLVNTENKFIDANNDFIAKKPKNAKFYMGFVYRKRKIGLWLDEREGYFYVCEKIPKNAPNIYAMTTSDNRVNLVTAKKNARIFRDIIDLYYMGVMKYESIQLRDDFYKIMGLFGVR